MIKMIKRITLKNEHFFINCGIVNSIEYFSIYFNQINVTYIKTRKTCIFQFTEISIDRIFNLSIITDIDTMQNRSNTQS
jgi:hypothetical protein